MEDLPDHAKANRTYWDAMASQWVSAGERSWKQWPPTWGIWALPESELGLLPGDMTGQRAIELGCGTAYVSAWMSRLGADVVGIDNSALQLATAARLAAEHGIDIELIHGSAEDVPCADSTFDFAISEYGAAIWCDPYRWIPEAYRLLKPGGLLTFLGTHPLAVLAMPLDGAPCNECLNRPYFGLHELDWRHVPVDPGGIEFNLPQSSWLRLFRDVGFAVVDYLELQAPTAAAPLRFSVPGDWARRWPSEHVWKLRK